MAQATCSLCSRSANIACNSHPVQRHSANQVQQQWRALTDHVQQHPTKKGRVVRLSTVLEFHVDPDVHNAYATGATNKVSAEALEVIVDAVTKAEERKCYETTTTKWWPAQQSPSSWTRSTFRRQLIHKCGRGNSNIVPWAFS